MNQRYVPHQMLADDVARVITPRGIEVWVRVKASRRYKCEVTGRRIKPGEFVWRSTVLPTPPGRVCDAVISQLRLL